MTDSFVVSERDMKRLQTMLTWFEHTGRAMSQGRRRQVVLDSEENTYIAEVDSNATGGGYYNCYLQSLDATNWDTNNDICSDTGDTIVVLNLAETGTSGHVLTADDKIICSKFIDDEGNDRYIGIGWTAITVITDVQVDGPNSELEDKTRTNVMVLAASAESAWTVFHTGDTC